MNRQFQNLLDQWHSTPRLRLGVILVITILLFQALLSYDDTRMERRSELYDLTRRNARTSAAARDEGLQQRAAALSTLRDRVEKSFFHATTNGLAQANIRSAILAILTEQGLPTENLTVDAPQPAPPIVDGRVLRVNYFARIDPAKSFTLLEALEASSMQIIVDRFSIRSDAEKNFSLGFRVFCIIRQ